MERTFLNSKEVAKRAGISVQAFYKNKKLYDSANFDKSIVNLRGRKSRKRAGVFRMYWYLNNTYYGFNKKGIYGGSTIQWYSDKVDELFGVVGLKGLGI